MTRFLDLEGENTMTFTFYTQVGFDKPKLTAPNLTNVEWNHKTLTLASVAMPSQITLRYMSLKLLFLLKGYQCKHFLEFASKNQNGFYILKDCDQWTTLQLSPF